MTARTAKPLANLRILDASLFVAGPFATALLGELGAQVIKVEPPGGDPVRGNRMGPQIDGESAQFHSYNHDKLGLVLDLKSAAGREVFLDLAAVSDAVFDNFRPGVMVRLRLDHKCLAERNPALVTVSLSAFGVQGPWAKRPGYDLLVQALSGAMSLTGHPETGPAHIPYHLGDTAGGLYAAIALLAAINEAKASGRGRAYEVSMLDAQLHLSSDEVTFLAAGDWPAAPHGSGHPALAPYGAFETADHPIVIAAVGVEKFWHNLAAALGRTELAEDPRFADNAARVANRAVLEAILRDILQARPRREWLELFEAADVPAGPVASLAEATSSEHVRARDLLATLETPGGGGAVVPRVPIRRLGEAPLGSLAPAPSRDSDGTGLLGELLDYGPEKIAKLRAAGAFGRES